MDFSLNSHKVVPEILHLLNLHRIVTQIQLILELDIDKEYSVYILIGFEDQFKIFKDDFLFIYICAKNDRN